MKDFSYYSENEHEYPSLYMHTQYLISVINDEPLTKAERDKRLAEVNKVAMEWFIEAVKPYNECLTQRRNEFWQDARKELCYGHWPKKIITMVEVKAWEDGHSGGFNEVYNCLVDLVYFVEDIMEIMDEYNS